MVRIEHYVFSCSHWTEFSQTTPPGDKGAWTPWIKAVLLEKKELVLGKQTSNIYHNIYQISSLWELKRKEGNSLKCIWH